MKIPLRPYFAQNQDDWTGYGDGRDCFHHKKLGKTGFYLPKEKVKTLMSITFPNCKKQEDLFRSPIKVKIKNGKAFYFDHITLFWEECPLYGRIFQGQLFSKGFDGHIFLKKKIKEDGLVDGCFFTPLSHFSNQIKQEYINQKDLIDIIEMMIHKIICYKANIWDYRVIENNSFWSPFKHLNKQNILYKNVTLIKVYKSREYFRQCY